MAAHELERVDARRARPRTGPVDPEVLPERHERRVGAVAEPRHEEERARAPVLVAHLHPAHRDRRGAGVGDDRAEGGVLLLVEKRGVVVRDERHAEDVEAAFDRQRGVREILDDDVEEMGVRDVRERTLPAQDVRQGRVDERGVVEGEPGCKVGPRLGVPGLLDGELAPEGDDQAGKLVPVLPMCLLALLRLRRRLARTSGTVGGRA